MALREDKETVLYLKCGLFRKIQGVWVFYFRSTNFDWASYMGQALCWALGPRNVYLFCQCKYVCCNLPRRLRFCLFLSFVSTCFIHFDAVFVACSFRTGIETTMKCFIFSSFFAFWSSLCQVLHFLLVNVGGRMGSVLFLFTVGLSISFCLRCIFQVACN